VAAVVKCLETRKRDGMKWRRYRTDDGRIVTTYELPVTVLRSVVAPPVLDARLAKFTRGEAIRTRQVAVQARLAEGVKPLAVADEFGLSVRQAERVRQSIK
jgi:hypothetical protein